MLARVTFTCVVTFVVTCPASLIRWPCVTPPSVPVSLHFLNFWEIGFNFSLVLSFCLRHSLSWFLIYFGEKHPYPRSSGITGHAPVLRDLGFPSSLSMCTVCWNCAPQRSGVRGSFLPISCGCFPLSSLGVIRLSSLPNIAGLIVPSYSLHGQAKMIVPGCINFEQKLPKRGKNKNKN